MTPSSIITAMHYCVPTRRLTNAELVERFGERQLKSIVRMSGIEERRVVSPGETAADLAYAAARTLLDDRGIDVRTIDLLVFASQTGDYQLPATACARKALLLNAEALTTVIHPLDRGLVPLHGDGAVATLVEVASGDGGILGFFLGTEGRGYHHLIIPASGARMPRSEATRQEERDESGIVRTKEHLHMDGAAIFHFSVYKVPDVIREALTRFGLTIGDIDLVLLHQANKTMVQQIYRALEVPPEKQFLFMEKIGNLSGPSTPVVLAEAWRQARIKPGSRTLLAAFGVGLSWGVTVIQWPRDLPPAVQGPVDYAEAAS